MPTTTGGFSNGVHADGAHAQMLLEREKIGEGIRRNITAGPGGPDLATTPTTPCG